MAVQFVSVISKDNVPLYFRSYGVPNELELQLQYLVHTCLDIIEEESACGNGALHLSTAGLYHGSSPCRCSQQFMHNVAMSTIASWEATPSAHSDPREYYLGLLSFTEDHKIDGTIEIFQWHSIGSYGYATNTRVKFVIVTENVPMQKGDLDTKELFKMLHASYVETMCNPFYVPGEKIHTKKFDNTVLSIFQRSRSSS